MLDWRALPSLTALRAFDARARHGSFAEAARALNVTHAAVAQQVRALETELGHRLATRQGRQVQLTDAGRQLALALADGFGTIADAVGGLRDRARSRALRVTTTPFLTERVIMPHLASFRRRDFDPSGPILRGCGGRGIRSGDPGGTARDADHAARNGPMPRRAGGFDRDRLALAAERRGAGPARAALALA
ncbi:regulatory helix-turn-helix protein, lysR family [Jannaschia seohaensis]|uniref:Regulatory helix-turn-helix LysR family protein n=1 Tax=Jannaschia seohaensis TaxID=475081 RepID=A0A2Y9C966_9RHOB|nr:LysR family transcriptional regulator [Jannaschia seohaensis]PWJ10922.1 regulatory helix-turn-helix LysR family protein [Jannaschia seohaensis]SSA51523.1 regulatory helix-turn-helix protein, lysR family [Jannaschia seohaensis]